MPGKILARYHTAEGNGEILSAVFCPYFFKNAAVLRYGDVWIGPIAFLYQSEISSSKTGGFPHHGRRFRMSHILESCRKASGSWWRFSSIRCKLLILDGETSNPIFFQFISETTLAPLNHFWHFWLSDPKDRQNCVGNGSGTPLYHAVARGNTSSGCSKYHRDEHFNTEKWWNYQATSRSSGWSSGTAWLWDLETVWSSGCWDVTKRSEVSKVPTHHSLHSYLDSWQNEKPKVKAYTFTHPGASNTKNPGENGVFLQRGYL